ncbi:MAG TPA: MFS transporter [Chthonomonadaceae bacterium]|nr:MFS transporter [Chthonomonadaceae bacterium]
MAYTTRESEVPTDRAGGKPPLSRWQMLTIALMLVGYAGYYLCRVHLSVATPQLLEAFKAQGLTKTKIGDIVSLGTIFYAAGKFLNGSFADFLGGKKMFLIGMGGAVLCTLFFGASSTIPLFTLAWALNRGVQSGGWAGLVKVSSRWFSYSLYGTVMGVISLSYLFGDFLSRLFLGQLIKWHMDWRGVFFTAAGVLAVIFVFNLLLLKEAPHEVGEPDPPSNPDNVYGEAGHEAQQAGILSLLLPLLSSPTFWIVCALSFGFTMVRETFNTWIPTYLHEAVGMAKGDAAQASSLFPLFGGFSVLLAGFLSDRLGRQGRALIILVGLLLTIPALFMLAYVKFHGSPILPIILFGAIAFVMLGPYSFLAGAIGMDFGGKKGSATASGWIDGIGYIGGILAGTYIGSIADKQGWESAFMTLAYVAIGSFVAAGIYLWQQSRPVAIREGDRLG